MKLEVDQEKCIGCGACVAISPENFDFNDEGLSTVKNDEIVDTTMDAVEACPTFAITVKGDEKQEETCECEQCCSNSEYISGDECHCDEECHCEGANKHCDGDNCEEDD